METSKQSFFLPYCIQTVLGYPQVEQQYCPLSALIGKPGCVLFSARFFSGASLGVLQKDQGHSSKGSLLTSCPLRLHTWSQRWTQRMEGIRHSSSSCQRGPITRTHCFQGTVDEYFINIKPNFIRWLLSCN